MVSGIIENKGATAIKAASIFFKPVTKDYVPYGTIQVRMLNNVNILTTAYGELQEVKPGQKLSFETHSMENQLSSGEASQKYLEQQKTATLIAVEFE